MTPAELMQQAIDAALENVRSGSGGPFGAVVARDGRPVATAVNRVTVAFDPTAHAEVEAIRMACRTLGTFDLSGCELYSSCEPCPMCFGAIYWSRLDRVYFGATSEDAAAALFDDGEIYREIARPHTDRRIPFVPLSREQAQAPFREWLSKIDRTPY